ncbi:MAG: LysM peptidoglycan-binding domain-containing protein [Betaproteobacteria bacterium]|nr:LysM peptidoglycan-binding domain-containing protein [Betaproteobacteria bacterium]
MASRPLVLSALALLLASGCAQLPDRGADLLQASEAAATAPVLAQPPAEPVTRVTEPAAAPEPPKTTPPPPPADLWERMRTGFRLGNGDGPLLRGWEQWYSSRPDYVARMVERGSRYLFHVVEEIERRRMPAEIALLPMIESAYNPQAYSRAHASGMWQFIPSTGKHYGLRQNFWYDGRRDVIAATNAALDYLEKLHGMFGDWELALAAYNWGEGAVSRAMARNQAKGLPTDYGSLTMPNETRNYVPKLLAVKNIIADPARFGLQLAAVPNEPYFATVTTSRHIDVKLAAKLAEISMEEFRFLNPAHNKPVIKADGSETIVLPRARVETFRRNLEAHDKPLASWQTYTMKRGDQPQKIAAKHGITLAQLKEINGVTGKKTIGAGQTLLVPHRGHAEPHLPDLPAPKLTRVRHKPKAKHAQGTRKGGSKPGAVRQTAVKKPAAGGPREPAKPATIAVPARPSGGNVVVAQTPTR